MKGYTGGSPEFGSFGVQGRDGRLKAVADGRSQNVAKQGEQRRASELEAKTRLERENATNEFNEQSVPARSERTSSETASSDTHVQENQKQEVMVTSETVMLAAVLLTTAALKAAERLPKPLRQKAIAGIIVVAGVAVVAVACSPLPGTLPTLPTVDANRPTMSATLPTASVETPYPPAASATAEVVKPTAVEIKPSVTVAPTVEPTKAPVYAGGALTAEQQNKFNEQDTYFKDFWKYWAGAGLVNADSVSQRQAHIKIDPKNPNSMCVAYEVDGKLWGFPFFNEDMILFPPKNADGSYKYIDGQVVAGNSTLNLVEEKTEEDGTKVNLGCGTDEKGKMYWTYVDAKGQMVERTNKGIWEKIKQVETIQLSMDPANPTQVEWNKLMEAKFSSPNDKFSDQAAWGNGKLIHNDESNWDFFVFSQTFSAESRPIKRGGFISTKTPEGVTMLIMREVVKFKDGTTDEWLFWWDPRIIPEGSKQEWYTKTLLDPDKYYYPLALNAPDSSCPGMSSTYVCKLGRHNNDAEIVKSLAETGTMPKLPVKQIYIPEGELWSNPW